MDYIRLLRIWKCRYFKWCQWKRVYLDSEDVLKRYGQWIPPSEDIAKKKHQEENYHHDIYDVRSTKTRELKAFGQGHLLYFFFLKYMAFLFAGLSILPGIVIFSFFCSGNWYSTSDLQGSTLGNFGLISHQGTEATLNWNLSYYKGYEVEQNISRYFLSDATRVPAELSSGINKRSAQVATAALALTGCLIYFIVTIILIWLMNRHSRTADDHTTSVHDYSVFVTGLPLDAKASALRQYFQVYGDVEAVELARACSTLVSSVNERTDVVHQLEVAVALLQWKAAKKPKIDAWYELEVLELEAYKAELEQDIEYLQRSTAVSMVVGAFVTFKSDLGKAACLQAQPLSFIDRKFMKPEKRFMNKYALKVVGAPEPTDIKYENLEVSDTEFVLRGILTTFIKYLLLLIGFFLTSAAAAVRNSLSGLTNSSSSTAQCLSTCNYIDASGDLYLNSTMQVDYKTCYDEGVWPSGVDCGSSDICYKCYCLQVIDAGNYGQSLYCNEFESAILMSIGSQILSVLGIVAVNWCLAWAGEKLTQMERHPTSSSESRSLAKALFLYQFINTAFSIIIANAYLPWFASLFSGSALSGILFSGIYPDLTPDWYTYVGRPILISQFTALLVRLSIIGYRFGKAWWYLKERNKTLAQCEMDDAFLGPEFELATRYGEQLTVVFVVLLFAGAMPLLLWVAAASFAAHYWLEKLELLKLSRRPPLTDAKLGIQVMELLPFAALWNLIFSCWAFSLFGVPPSSLASSTWTNFMNQMCSGMSWLWSAFSNYQPSEVAARLVQENGLPFFVFLLICGATLLVFFSLKMWIVSASWIRRSALRCCGKEKEAPPVVSCIPDFPVAVRSQLLAGIETYEMQRNPNYAFAFVRFAEEKGGEGYEGRPVTGIGAGGWDSPFATGTPTSADAIKAYTNQYNLGGGAAGKGPRLGVANEWGAADAPVQADGPGAWVALGRTEEESPYISANDQVRSPAGVIPQLGPYQAPTQQSPLHKYSSAPLLDPNSPYGVYSLSPQGGSAYSPTSAYPRYSSATQMAAPPPALPAVEQLPVGSDASRLPGRSKHRFFRRSSANAVAPEVLSLSPPGFVNASSYPGAS